MFIRRTRTRTGERGEVYYSHRLVRSERTGEKVRQRTLLIFPNEDAITRLIGAVLLEQNDEWAVSRRYMTLESIAPVSDTLTVKLPAVAA